jgi:hypothetical protein
MLQQEQRQAHAVHAAAIPPTQSFPRAQVPHVRPRAMSTHTSRGPATMWHSSGLARAALQHGSSRAGVFNLNAEAFGNLGHRHSTSPVRRSPEHEIVRGSTLAALVPFHHD